MQQPVVLIMGGRGKGSDYRPLFARFSGVIAALILFGEDAALINQQAEAIAERHLVADVAAAVALAAGYQHDVLFSPACASFDQYRDFNARGDDFKAQVKRVVQCR